MTDFVTISDRKNAKVEAILAALPALERDLADYAKAHGGRFWLFGSAVTGRLHYDSDIDVLADFPVGDIGNALGNALDFVQDWGAKHDLPIDAFGLAYCKPDFLERVMPRAKALA